MFKPQMALLITALACSSLLAAPPVRKFDDPGAPPFKVLKDGENPPLDAIGNFVVGPKYVRAPERKKVDGIAEGTVKQFVIDSKVDELARSQHPAPKGRRAGDWVCLLRAERRRRPASGDAENAGFLGGVVPTDAGSGK